MGVDEFIAETRATCEAMLAPIDGGVGADISYEPAFEEMKAEVDKMQSIEGGRVDWSMIARNATTILEEQSKDFRVVLYMGAARAQTEGALGLFQSLVVLDGLIEAFWEPMYPALKRPRARGNLCPWFAELSAPAIDAWNPTVKDRNVALAFDVVFRRVDNELADKLGEAYPGMLSVREAVRRLLLRTPAEAAPPPPPPPPPAPKAQDADASTTEEEPEVVEEITSDEPESAASGGGGGFSADDIQDVGSAYQVFAEVLPLFRRASEVFREADTASPEARRFAMIGKLLFLNAPISAPEGETEIDGPDAGIVETTVALHGAEDWEGLLAAAEGLTAEMPLWLDGYFYAVQAFRNLGETYDAPRRVVEAEVAALMIRAPGIADLKFAGGAPFASDEAKAWMGSLASGAGASAPSGAGAPGGGKDPLAKALVQAQELLAQEQLPQAVALLHRAAAAAGSPLVRFRAKLEGAKLALNAGFADLARAQLEGLDRIVERHRLDEWDPDLVVQLYGTLYRAQRAAGQAESEVPEARARVAATWERLCQLDPSAALKMLMEVQ